MVHRKKSFNLLKTAGKVDQETEDHLKGIYKKCAICHKYTRPRM